jgi:hypothetical protein
VRASQKDLDSINGGKLQEYGFVSVATTLLERGMPIEQIQKFLRHVKLETTQVYAESTAEMIKDSYRKALTE